MVRRLLRNLQRSGGAVVMWAFCMVLFCTIGAMADDAEFRSMDSETSTQPPVDAEQIGAEESPAPQRRRRKLSILSNILDDLGLSPTQKTLVVVGMLIVLVGGRYAQGLSILPKRARRRVPNAGGRTGGAGRSSKKAR